MIENKVGAGLEPLQAERYRVRGDSYIADGHCAAYHTVIVAPARYFSEAGGHKGFDSRVTYEQILQWFLGDQSLGERRHYKAALLRSAIDKATIGYQPEEDAPTTKFWLAYWGHATKFASRLEMRKPNLKPSGSGFIYFRPPSLPRGVEICHKFNRGFVDLQLNGMGMRLNEVNTILGPHFDSDMQLIQAAKSAAIRLQVPILKASVAVEAQELNVRAGLDAAMRLLIWFLGNRDVWLSHVASAHQSASADRSDG
ncbi:MAG: hypothetical protein SGJ20_10015 [Planctomycetota bacterium]|nr:hypothetical protein [Planctomycetota bacterium]